MLVVAGELSDEVIFVGTMQVGSQSFPDRGEERLRRFSKGPFDIYPIQDGLPESRPFFPPLWLVAAMLGLALIDCEAACEHYGKAQRGSAERQGGEQGDGHDAIGREGRASIHGGEDLF